MTSVKPQKISILEVEDLRLVDKDGSMLARLSRNELGAFGLSIGESATGMPMISLSIAPTGEPVVEIRDRQGHRRAGLLMCHRTGVIDLGLRDENEQVRARLTVTAAGDGLIGVYDPSDAPKAVMKNIHSTSNHPGIISTYNGEARPLWQTPSKKLDAAAKTKPVPPPVSQVSISFGKPATSPGQPANNLVRNY